MNASKRFCGILFLSFFLLFTFSVQAQMVEKLIEEGDQYTEEFNNQKALDTYLNADKLYPNNWEILWRISRAYVDIGEHMPEKTDEQKAAQLLVYQKAFDYADKSVKLASDKSVTYARRPLANG